jgi:hypothetical protein
MMRPSTFLFLMAFIIVPTNGQARASCATNDMPCLFKIIESETMKMDEPRWRNQAYRDLAVSKAMAADYDGATALINQIDNADTQAMTIRAIGMAIAIHQDLSDETYKHVFAKLDKSAQGIKDDGAKDIAYTYIAMAQAFAGLDNDAMQTTLQMTNPALKNKAYGETAEIQAERGDKAAALASLNAIGSSAFKNKALAIVSGIFLKNNDVDTALSMAMMIDNPTKKISAIQKIIDKEQGLNEMPKRP